MKQKAVVGNESDIAQNALKNAVMSLLRNVEDTFLKKLVNIHVLLLTLWSRLQLFAWRTDEKMPYKLSFVI